MEIKKIISFFLLSIFIITNINSMDNSTDEINTPVKSNYIDYKLGTDYEKIITRLKWIGKNYIRQKDKIIINSTITQYNSIKSNILYFNNGILTNLFIYIEKPDYYFSDLINEMKNDVDIKYTNSNNNEAVWTDGKITIGVSLLKINEFGEEKNLICIRYFVNEYKISDENEIKTTNKSLEFAIGGGLCLSYLTDFFIISIAYATFMTQLYYPFWLNIEADIPFSFTYYNKNYGIGFTYDIGAKLELNGGGGPFFMDLNNEILLSQKYGEITEGYFLFEMGASFLGRFKLRKDSSIVWTDNEFLCGPIIFFGGEVKNGGNFLFMVGGVFGVSFGYPAIYSYIYDNGKTVIEKRNELHVTFSIGLKFRFRYYYSLYLK